LLVWTLILISCEIIKVIFARKYDFHKSDAIPLEFCSTFWLFFVILTIYVFCFPKNKTYYQLIIHLAFILCTVLFVGVLAVPNLIYGDWTWSLYYGFKNNLPDGTTPPSLWFWIFFASHSICYHFICMFIVGLIIINNHQKLQWKKIYLGIIYYAIWNAVVCTVSFATQFDYMQFLQPFFLPKIMWNQWTTGILMYFLWIIGISGVLYCVYFINNKLINRQELHVKNKK
jgi:hypothetical protein